MQSLRRNVLLAGIANAVFALTQWGIVVVVARLGTPAEVGAVTFVTALITPIFMFAQMAMRDGHTVDDLDQFTRADYVALRMVASFLALTVIIILILTYLSSSGSHLQLTAAAFAVVKLLGAQTNMNHGMFQRAERLDYLAASVVARGVLGLAGFGICYWYTRSLPLAFLTEAVVWWLCLWAVDRPLLHRLKSYVPLRDALSVRPTRILLLARWTFPLGLAIFLMTASTSVPRLFLEHYSGLHVVGIFGAIAYINVAINTFSNSIGMASAARLRRQYRQGAKQRFVSLSLKLTALSAGLGAFLWLASLLYGETVLRLLYGADYARHDILQLAMAAAALRITAAPLQFAITAGQAFWRRMANSSLTFLTALAASLVLIPSEGAIGAAWTLVVMSAANVALTTFTFIRLYKHMPVNSHTVLHSSHHD